MSTKLSMNSKTMGTCRRTTNKHANNLIQEMHSQDHGHLSLLNNCQVNNIVQDLHLLDLHGILDGFLHCRDHSNLSMK